MKQVKQQYKGRSNVWPRIAEIILGIWLLISQFILSYGTYTLTWIDFLMPFLIFLFAALSYIQKLNKIHLLHILPAAWLFTIAYSYPIPWLPLGLQNYILLAITLLTFAILPSHASDHPRAWQAFLKEKK